MEEFNIISVLQNLKTIFKQSVDDPKKVLRELCAIIPSRYMVYPCETIELRRILREGKIRDNNPISLFSYRFAEKYLKDYSVFLIIDSKNIEFDTYRYGGACFVFSDIISIGDNLIKIVVNGTESKMIFDVVKQLTKELGIGAECLISNTIPFEEQPKQRIAMKKAQVEKDVNLTPQEKKIFSILIGAKKEFNLPIDFRVAGGWVRDKLLGKNSDDIDIAVGMPGFDLAQIIFEYGKKHNLNVKDPYKVSLDKSSIPIDNDNKSSNLMVGSIYIEGVKIEFVPMRTESYPDENSRQPVIIMTNDPKEDVKRRDLTINALLYNIETGKIEDYVGGIADLGLEKRGRTGIHLRTPDDPKKTFMEDPLRMLRVLRFHSRYDDSHIDNGIIEAMSDPSVQEAYRKKVATERAGPEIMKMLVGEDPTSALNILFDTGLYKRVFDVPSMEDISPEGIHMDQKTPYHKFNLKGHILETVRNLNQIMKNNGESDKMRGLMNLSALFHDIGKMKSQKPHPTENGRMQYIGHEIQSEKMADEIMRSVGVGKDDRDIVSTVIRLHMRPHQASEWSSKAKGKFLRETRMHGKEEEHKDLWKYIFYHAQADEMSSQPENYDSLKTEDTFNKFKDFVNSPSGIFNKPLITGNDIINIFPDIHPKTGYIQYVLNMAKEFQDGGMVNMSFVNLPESPEKEVLKQQAKNDLIELVKNKAPEIRGKYQMEQKNMASNWFKQVKSQAIPLGDISDNDEDIVKGPGFPQCPYRKGMRVRDRRRGMVNPQEYGVVDDIKNNKVIIVWNNNGEKKKSIFDLTNDMETLSMIVAEV